MNGFRLAARLARRETRKRPWRTALVALLVAFPVAGMTMAVGFVRTEHLDAAESWRRQWGPNADAVVTKDPDSEPASLPPGSRVQVFRNLFTLVRSVDRERAQVDVTDMAIELQVMDGRAPTTTDDVFLTRDVAKRLGVKAGDVLHLDRPVAMSLRVTGTGERRSYWGSHTMVLGPGTTFPWENGREAAGITHVVDLPDGATAADLPLADSDGLQLAPWIPGGFADTGSRNDAVAWSWVIGAVVLTVVGIVIASAFAAGARRQLATLGQLAANGAPPAILRRVLFLQGTWTGLLGTVLGFGLGTLGLVTLAPHADRMFGRDVDPWTLRFTDLLPIAVLGVAAATIAASIPGRTTSRIPVLAALAGRRPLGRVPHWVTVAGAFSTAGGLALLGLAALGGTAEGSSGGSQVWAVAAVAGGVAVLLGACGVAPAFTSLLEPLGGRLQGSWRLAARSLARQRTRTSAVVAAVCASAALAVAASAVVSSIEAENVNDIERVPLDEVHITAPWSLSGPDIVGVMPRPPGPTPEVVSGVQSALPGSELLPLTVAQSPSTDHNWALDEFRPDPSAGADDSYHLAEGSGSPFHVAVVADSVALRAYGLRDQDRRTLEREGALLLEPTPGKGILAVRPVDFRGRPMPPPPGSATVRRAAPIASLPVTVADSRPYSLGFLPRLLLSPTSVQRLGLATVPGAVVVRSPHPLTDAQRDRLAELTEDLRLEIAETAGVARSFDFHIDWEQPDDDLNPLLLEALLSGVSLLFSLFVVATGLALAAAETRDERDGLTVVGASPSAMRGTSGRKATLLAGLGAVLAVPVGFLPVVVLIVADNGARPIVFPWRVVLLLLVAVPAVAGLVTTAGSAVALRLRPVRISTMAFD